LYRVGSRRDAIFAIEREINGLPSEQRLAAHTTRIAPLVSELEASDWTIPMLRSALTTSRYC
jgi:hypothetical protein